MKKPQSTKIQNVKHNLTSSNDMHQILNNYAYSYFGAIIQARTRPNLSTESHDKEKAKWGQKFSRLIATFARLGSSPNQKNTI